MFRCRELHRQAVLGGLRGRLDGQARKGRRVGVRAMGEDGLGYHVCLDVRLVAYDRRVARCVVGDVGDVGRARRRLGEQQVVDER